MNTDHKTESSQKLGYRKSVVGVFTNEHNQVLALERTDTPQAWQFPQGGIEDGESACDALLREMEEELGNKHITYSKQSKRAVSYDFPDKFHAPIAQHFSGQSSWWFLCQFTQGGPDLANAKHKEFQKYIWLAPELVIERTVFWKKNAYREGLTLLGFTLG
ncbi:MAG: NUDIX domain-containing protein [Proteobacteria bacterium]|nr:NUDIX domain-containing protein [Pseudomonadota bacterium]